MGFKRAIKSQSKLRAAMFGPSGAGKTYTALAIASGMGTRIALIDSERSSASKYADRFEFDQVDLNDKTIEEYVQYINEAAAAGYDVLIIDSLSHAWEVLNEEVQRIADTSFRGNFWSAWSKGTPMQRKLVDAILSYPGHVIATMRSKTEWQSSSGGEGKKSGPVRVGLAPEQGKGIEYEFDILFEISTEHIAHIIKDRTGKFQDKLLEKPGKQFGEDLVKWLNEGTPDMKLERDSKSKELGTILKSEDNGKRLFSDDEVNRVKAELQGNMKLCFDEQIPLIETKLAEYKELMKQRIVALASQTTPPAAAQSALPQPASPKKPLAPLPVAPQPAQIPPPATEPVPTTENAAEPTEEEIIAWRKEKLREKLQGITPATPPAQVQGGVEMEHFDPFEEDVPDTGDQNEDELDLF
jgi:hypothetical protein